MRFHSLPSICGLALVATASVACADVVQLTSGARLTGKLPQDQSRTTLTIQLEGGGRVTLDRNQVASVSAEPAALVEYRKRAPTAPDTVASQLALAEWCRQRKLGDEYRRHLNRVVQLDPEHEQARTALGHQKHAGQWLSRAQLMAVRGMVRFEGAYRTRQEVALLERSQRAKKNFADWKDRLKRWRRDLGDRDPRESAQAIANYQKLTDPAAGSALAAQLLAERDPSTKQLLIQTAAQVRTPATARALTKLSLEDEDEEVRLVCLEHLSRANTPGLAEPFIRALRSKSNAMVNRGALALKQLESRSAIAPLIDALVTEHRFKVGEDSGGGDRYDFNAASGGFKFGGGGTKIIKRELKNPQVLSTLVYLTQENYGYDQPAWRAWLASGSNESPLDIRRDK